MTYEGPVEDTIPEYMITCNECGRTEYVRAWAPEPAEELFIRNGWTVRGRLAYCRECARKEWEESE